MCVLPFTYMGTTYQECTGTPQRGTQNKAWCLTDASNAASFEYCVGMETSEMSVLLSRKKPRFRFSCPFELCVCYATFCKILLDSSDFKTDWQESSANTFGHLVGESLEKIIQYGD